MEARWLPSAVDRFADALSRTWDPRDARATQLVVESVRQEYGLDPDMFRDRPLGGTMMTRTKYLATQMEDDWGDGLCRLWNPPFDAFPSVIRKMEGDGGKYIVNGPHWLTHAWCSRLRRLVSRLSIMQPTDQGSPLLEGLRIGNESWGVVVAEVS